MKDRVAFRHASFFLSAVKATSTSRAAPVVAAAVAATTLLFACRSDRRDAAGSSSASALSTASEGAPEGVAPPLPASGAMPPASASASAATIVLPPPPKPVCPPDMVLVKDRLCVDRFEDTIVDDTSGKALSPYWPPDGPKATYLEKIWRDLRGTGTELEQATELPLLPPFQKQRSMRPRAVSKKGVVPQAYASGKDAALACANAHKRLCTLEEWRTACRGQEDRDFPYGDKYQQGTCNVVRDTHPGILLWDNPSINHTDPRFNLMTSKTGALLRKTGATTTCKSKWGDDAIYDMVGNLDEWIDDPEGTFVGAFYARGRRDGCQAKIVNHTFDYADYSTGVRCCAEPSLP